MYKFGDFLQRVSAFSFLLIICALICCPNASARPALSAESAILIRADNGEPIAEYNADHKSGMASTTKIMTAILAIENGDLDREITVPDQAIGVEGSSLYLKQDEKITMRDLVYGLLLQSANDAAEAIAIEIAGSIEAFADKMNQKAEELGLKNTHFTNPHGLADENHYTTARELAMIAKYALENPIFREICSTLRATISNNGDGNRYLINHNKLLAVYDGTYGVKTGFTKATGRCLVSAAERNGVSLIAVTLNAPSDWNDHMSLFNYGFDTYECVDLAASGEIQCKLPVIGGVSETVTLTNTQPLRVCVKKNRGSIVSRIELNRPHFAPIYAGQVLGRVVFLLDGIEIASADLEASSYIEKTEPKKHFLIFQKIFQTG